MSHASIQVTPVVNMIPEEIISAEIGQQIP
jgi:hypothetical protein